MTRRESPLDKARNLIRNRGNQQNGPYDDELDGDSEMYSEHVPHYEYNDSVKDALGKRMGEHGLVFPEDPNDEQYSTLLTQARNIDKNLAVDIQSARTDVAAGRDNHLLKGERMRARRAAGGGELVERIFYRENASGHPTLNKGLIGGLALVTAAGLFFLLGNPVDTTKPVTTGDGVTVTAADGGTTTTYPDRVVDLSIDGIETTTYTADKRVRVVDLKTGVSTVTYPDKVVVVTQKDGSSVKTLADGTVLRYDSEGQPAVNLPPNQIDAALNDPDLVQTPRVTTAPAPATTINGPADGSESVGPGGGAPQAVTPPPDGTEDSGAGGFGDLTGTGQDTGVGPQGGSVDDGITVAGPIDTATDPFPADAAGEPDSTVQSGYGQDTLLPVGSPFPEQDASLPVSAPLPVQDPGPLGVTSAVQDSGAALGGDQNIPSSVVALPPPETRTGAGFGGDSGQNAVGGNAADAIPRTSGGQTGGQANGQTSSRPATPPTVTIRQSSPLPVPADTNAGQGNGGSSSGPGQTTSNRISGVSGTGSAGPTSASTNAQSQAGTGSGTNASTGAGNNSDAAGPKINTYTSAAGTGGATPGGRYGGPSQVITRAAVPAAANVLKRSQGADAGSSGAPDTSNTVLRRKVANPMDPEGRTGVGTSMLASQSTRTNSGTGQFTGGTGEAATDTTGLMGSPAAQSSPETQANPDAKNDNGVQKQGNPAAQGNPTDQGGNGSQGGTNAPGNPGDANSDPSGKQPASPYKPGQYLRATLETGMILPVDGAQTPAEGLVVFARTQDGTLWLGTPSISPTRRMSLSFKRAQLRDGTSISLNAQAYNNDGTPGIKAEFKPEAPSLVDDLIRGTISGVRDYAEAKIQATRTTTGAGGSVVVERQVPTIFESVAASAAGVFQLPPTQATFINTARVSKGQSFVIVVTPPPLQNP